MKELNNTNIFLPFPWGLLFFLMGLLFASCQNTAPETAMINLREEQLPFLSSHLAEATFLKRKIQSDISSDTEPSGS